ncbi:ubiquitin carboxyl-terminal hydrolase 22-like [Argiope bruennichi]|uniref:Ubiquitin carboxyl-terminal hydrolase n=1 Tax=Argiope bruennichi TaxID=94029 RepID=A0A8T0FKT1_ARGBR|nr:ubiquitin carboxyl-terminal hydrolase 22-like [Argiope bruennichi]KAF8791082.1 Ubiquitin carboxyl-terminal hydrolase 22 like protein [Argiope bruennichi]
MGTYSCPHLRKLPCALKTYNVILGYYVTCIAEDQPFQKLAVDAFCRVCKETKGKLHACLQCAFFGCFKSVDGNVSHMKRHALKYKHYFAINLNHGSLFCFQCDDYMYNETFDESLAEFEIEARKLKITQSFLTWKPNNKERALLKGKIVKISDLSYFGLRGIVNIGNSCYINCIVQVLMHTPVLVDFFLRDKHVCTLESCLLCELFLMFQEFYSGKSIPYDPSERFFIKLQQFCSQPLGIQQQDCYELFQEILTGMHVNCPNKNDINCKCMIQQMFYGIAQGCKECQHCHDSSSLPPDCFMDILLDLDRKDDCLINVLNRKYLEKQLLSDYRCSNCEKSNTTYIRQHIKKLPNVVCFRMNCFLLEVNKISSRTRNRRMQKKSTAFAFEEFLNMSPYLNSETTNSSDRNGACAAASVPSDNVFRLFAVIFHKGTLQGGHYVTYIRQRHNWYECDDRFIYRRTMDEVLQCEPFLLFYQNYQ